MAIVVMGFVLGDAMSILDFSEVVEMTKSFLVPEVLSVLTFVLVAVLSFLTGEYWGMAAILLPAVLSLGGIFGVNPLLLAGATFSGAVMGSSICLFGDSNAILSSTVEIPQAGLAFTVLPYLLIAGGLSAAAYLVLGLVV